MTALQKRLRKKYTYSAGRSPNKSVFLHIDHQQFTITTGQSAEGASWYRDQLAIALSRLVQNETEK